MNNLFDLTGKVAVVTGGAGLLGLRHCEVLLAAGAKVVIIDNSDKDGNEAYKELEGRCNGPGGGAYGPFNAPPLCWYKADVTKQGDLANASEMIRKFIRFEDHVDILINNACNNPKPGNLPTAGVGVDPWLNPGMFDLRQLEWEADIAVGLTGPMLCSMVFGSKMAAAGSGVILNIASEYALIAPDQRLYGKPGLLEHQQPIKPSSYSVVKHGLVGLTRWLATYWAGKGVRVNCLSPGGVFDNQPEEFVERYVNTIPLGRMANVTDMQGAVLFLCSDASSFMTGANVVVDGGRSCW